MSATNSTGIPTPDNDASIPGSEGRAQSPNVAPHVTPPKGGPQVAGAASAQTGNQGTGNGAFNPFQPNNQFTNGAGGRQQQQMNPKLVLDFSLLEQCGAEASTFKLTPLGILLDMIAKQVGDQVKDIHWWATYGIYEATLGKAHIYYVTGLERRDSPLYRIPETVLPMNPWAAAMNGNVLTQAAWQQFAPGFEDEARIFIFEDDMEQCRDALAHFIGKCAFPNYKFGIELTEDQYMTQAAGPNLIDTKLYPQCGEALRSFCELNSVSALKVPSKEAVAISVTQQQWQGYGFGGGNGFGGFGQSGFGFQGGGFGGFGQSGFGANPFGGNNGGFGISGYNQQPATHYLAAAKYFIKSIDLNGYKKQVVHITEIIENRGIKVHGFIKHFVRHFLQMGYGIALDLDIGKLAPHIRKQVGELFVMNQFGMYGENPSVRFHDIVSYVHPESKARARFSPSFLTLSTFAQMYPDFAKMDKFPKSLATAEDSQKFEEFKAKAGFIQVLAVGDIHMIFNDGMIGSLMSEAQARAMALQNNMTLDEYMEAWKNAAAKQQQTPNNAQQAPGQGQPFAQNGFGFGGNNGFMNNGFGGFGQNGFGMPGMQNGFGGFGQSGFGNQMGFGQMPGMQMGGGFGQQPYGGMMGGMPGMGMPMGGMGMMPGMMGYGNPAYGMSGYPGVGQGNPNQKGNQKGGKPGQQPQPGNPMGYGGMMGGMPGMGMPMGGMGMMPGMMGGGFPGQPQGFGGQYPAYNPYMAVNPAVAGGAFPQQGAQQAPGSRFVPS
jgi:hypothetical protein